MSSFTVKLCFPENSSLNLSSTVVGRFDKFFKINFFLLKIAVKNKPGLNSNIISLNAFLFSISLSFFSNFFLRLSNA